MSAALCYRPLKKIHCHIVYRRIQYIIQPVYIVAGFLSCVLVYELCEFMDLRNEPLDEALAVWENGHVFERMASYEPWMAWLVTFQGRRLPSFAPQT